MPTRPPERTTTTPLRTTARPLPSLSTRAAGPTSLPSHFVAPRHQIEQPSFASSGLRASADAAHADGFPWTNPLRWPIYVADRSPTLRGLFRYGGVAMGIAATASALSGGGFLPVVGAVAAFYVAGAAMLARRAPSEVERDITLGPRRPVQAHTSQRVALGELEVSLEPFGATHTYSRENKPFATLALVALGVGVAGIATGSLFFGPAVGAWLLAPHFGIGKLGITLFALGVALLNEVARGVVNNYRNDVKARREIRAAEQRLAQLHADVEAARTSGAANLAELELALANFTVPDAEGLRRKYLKGIMPTVWPASQGYFERRYVLGAFVVAATVLFQADFWLGATAIGRAAHSLVFDVTAGVPAAVAAFYFVLLNGLLLLPTLAGTLSGFRMRAGKKPLPFVPSLKGIPYLVSRRSRLLLGTPALLGLAHYLTNSFIHYSEAYPWIHNKVATTGWAGPMWVLLAIGVISFGFAHEFLLDIYNHVWRAGRKPIEQPVPQRGFFTWDKLNPWQHFTRLGENHPVIGALTTVPAAVLANAFLRLVVGIPEQVQHVLKFLHLAGETPWTWSNTGLASNLADWAALDPTGWRGFLFLVTASLSLSALYGIWKRASDDAKAVRWQRYGQAEGRKAAAKWPVTLTGPDLVEELTEEEARSR